jgi:hypothetical protein
VAFSLEKLSSFFLGGYALYSTTFPSVSQYLAILRFGQRSSKAHMLPFTRLMQQSIHDETVLGAAIVGCGRDALYYMLPLVELTAYPLSSFPACGLIEVGVSPRGLIPLAGVSLNGGYLTRPPGTQTGGFGSALLADRGK